MPTPCCLVFSGLSDVRLALSALIISSREVASDMPLMPVTGTNFCTAFARFSDVAVQRDSIVNDCFHSPYFLRCTVFDDDEFR